MRFLALAAALAALLPSAAVAASPAPGAGDEQAQLKALLRSRELWATIDVCSPADQRDYVGIRGSMPADKKTSDKMYMAFRLQYLNETTKKWVDLASPKAPVYVLVGPSTTVRQGGRSFQLVPRTGKSAVTLRGVVSYQWRRKGKVLVSVSRPTTAGHTSVAGADPKGYSSATCSIG